MNRKTLRILVIFVVIACSTEVKAQTFMGKKFTFGVGTSLGLPILTEPIMRGHGNNDHTRAEITVLPPEIEVNAGLALSSRLLLNVRSSYSGLSDVNILYSTITPSSGQHYGGSYSHQFILRTNALDFGTEMKWFYEYAPIGKYLSIGGIYCMASGTVYGTLTTTIENIPYNDVELPQVEIIKQEPWSVQRNCFGISIGKGNVYQLTKVLTLDYGVKSSFFFGSRKFNIDYDPLNVDPNYDYEANFSESMESLMLGTLRSSYLLEFYLQFGFAL